MSVKTEYKCDICRDAMPTSELWGVRFSSLKDFKLGDPVRHEGTHICKRCVQQILDQCGASQGKGEGNGNV